MFSRFGLLYVPRKIWQPCISCFLYLLQLYFSRYQEHARADPFLDFLLTYGSLIIPILPLIQGQSSIFVNYVSVNILHLFLRDICLPTVAENRGGGVTEAGS
jgi:hypothetical protein